MITIKIRCLNHYIIKNKLAFFSALDNKSFYLLKPQNKVFVLALCKIIKKQKQNTVKKSQKITIIAFFLYCKYVNMCLKQYCNLSSFT